MLDTLFGIDATYPKTVAGWSQLLHPADREALLAYLLDQVLKGKQPFDRVYRIVRANDGNTCWVHGLGQLRCNAAGEVIGMFGIIQDITARKQLEMAVARERQLLRALIDHLPDAIYAKDSLGRKTLANPADVRFLGRATEAEVLGQDDFAFYPPEMAAKFFADDQAVIATGQPVLNFEDLFTDAQGHQQWLLCSKLPLRGADGEVIGLVGVGRDITERKQAEAEIHKLNAELEQRVVDRTAQLELVNQQLSAENTARRQAEEFVRGRNEELKSFAYTVSHDLKAPLRGISGYANELDRRHRAGLEERALFCIGQILTATRNLDHLIEDLLRFSRLDAEMPSLSRLDLRALVETILHDRSLIITEQRVEVTVNIPLITMEAWERGVAQVLANLIDNALKYSRQAQPPRLTITAEARPDGCRLTVADNGIGFDMKYHDRIFGLFNRLVRADQFEGTGAGLAIVKKLMEKLGGKIRAESGPGQGATFFVELPNQPNRKTPL